MYFLEIREELFNFRDHKYAKFSSSLIPGEDKLIGVRLPILRKIAKDMNEQQGKEYIHYEGEMYFEEIMLQGMVIGRLKETIDITLALIENHVHKITNWSLCDSFCSSLKICKKHKAEFWSFLQHYLISQKEYDLRFAVVMMMDYFIEEDYIDRVLNIITKINHEGRYVKMAVAWAMSVCYVKFPGKTLPYIEKGILDKFTHNMTIQKICDSFRVDMEEKEKIKLCKK